MIFELSEATIVTLAFGAAFTLGIFVGIFLILLSLLIASIFLDSIKKNQLKEKEGEKN